MRAAQARLELRDIRRAPVERRRQHAPGRRPGRPVDLAAADGGRLLDPGQRLHAWRRRLGRAPASGRRDRRAAGTPRAGAELPGGASRAPQRQLRQRRDAGHPRGREPAGGNLGRRLGRVEPVRTPGLRQDGHGRTPGQGRPVLVHVLHRRPQAPDRARGHRRGGRLRRGNGGADRAPAGGAVVRQGKEVRRRELAHVLRPVSPITAPEQPIAPPVTGPRTLRLPLDPLLTLAVVGLGIFSIVTLDAATKNLIPSQPSYYVDRQTTYLIVGVVLMLLL